MSSKRRKVEATLGKVEATLGKVGVTLGKVEVTLGKVGVTLGKVGTTLGKVEATLGKVEATFYNIGAKRAKDRTTLWQVTEKMHTISISRSLTQFCEPGQFSLSFYTDYKSARAGEFMAGLVFQDYLLLLMFRSQQIVNSLYRIECFNWNFNKNCIPIAHSTIPQSGKFERFQFFSVFRFE